MSIDKLMLQRLNTDFICPTRDPSVSYTIAFQLSTSFTIVLLMLLGILPGLASMVICLEASSFCLSSVTSLQSGVDGPQHRKHGHVPHAVHLRFLSVTAAGLQQLSR